jgi:uncharacterized protein YjiS (DUF1127 family)
MKIMHGTRQRRFRQQYFDDDHYARLRKLDSVALMQRGRTIRARTMRVMFRYARRRLRPVASALASALIAVLFWQPRPPELARYDERLLRDIGITSHDVRTARPRLSETLRTWLDRARQRKRLARFTERDLRDLALSKCDAELELSKPFWRA